MNQFFENSNGKLFPNYQSRVRLEFSDMLWLQKCTSHAPSSSFWTTEKANMKTDSDLGDKKSSTREQRRWEGKSWWGPLWQLCRRFCARALATEIQEECSQESENMRMCKMSFREAFSTYHIFRKEWTTCMEITQQILKHKTLISMQNQWITEEM